MKLEGKMQNGCHAKTLNNTLCTYVPAPVPVPKCICIHARVCRCTLTCICTWPKKPLHPTSKAKGKMAARLSFQQLVMQVHIYTSTMHTAPANQRNLSIMSFTTRDNERDHLKRRQTWPPWETTNVITSRDDVRDFLERWRTWSPRETTYVTTSRDDERDHLERRHMWLPWETTNVITAREG